LPIIAFTAAHHIENFPASNEGREKGPIRQRDNSLLTLKSHIQVDMPESRLINFQVIDFLS
jgi:hypothetical protein